MADEVILSDGSRLLGEVIKKEGDLLEFKTKFADTIKIKCPQVNYLRTEKPMTLMLKDESILMVNEINKSDKEDVLQVKFNAEGGDADQALEKKLKSSELSYVNPEPWRTGKGYKY